MVQHWTLAQLQRAWQWPERQGEGVGESGRHLDGVTQDGTMAPFELSQSELGLFFVFIFCFELSFGKVSF